MMKHKQITIFFCLLAGLALNSNAEASFAHKRIAVIGTGYVGLVLGVCLADFGHNVICADINKEKIKILNNGDIPIYEPGLKELAANNRALGTLFFSDDPVKAIEDSEIIFVAVDTPMSEDGQADLTAIKIVAKTIGAHLNSYKVICIKSTVPIGTSVVLKKIISENSSGVYNFELVSNPEFLKEGTAVNDFLYPHRVVIGAESERALKLMQDVYKPLLDRKVPFLYTDIVTAETIKYASNAFLATKIAFINEMAHLCDHTSADIKLVSKGMGMDPRIGSQFLVPGPGFGGSCFPKDSQALVHKGKSLGFDLKILQAAIESNADHRRHILNKLAYLLHDDFQNKTIAILGLSFKANTDDIRCSAAIEIIDYLLERGAHIKAYDPMSMHNMKKIYPQITYSQSVYEAAKDSHAVLILTEWDEFRTAHLETLRNIMAQPILVDTRNILSTKKLHELGFAFSNNGNAKID